MKTPIYTISGFLGAGKTTFVNGLLSQLADSIKVAIIVNELGEIAIDGRIIDRKAYVLQEITDGCICCTLRAKLADALMAIVEDNAPDLILLETTGVARPKQIVSEFHLKRLSEKVFSKRIINFLDAVIYARVGHNMPIINFQIEDADVIILNKIDLVGQKELSHIRERLKSFTGGNKTIHETRYGDIEYGHLIPEMRDTQLPGKEHDTQKSIDNRFMHDGPSLQHGHGFLDSTEGFLTISLEAYGTISQAFLKAFFNHHNTEIIRAKGLLKTKRGNRVLHFSSSGLQITDYSKSLNKNELVLIIEEKNRDAMEGALPDGFIRVVKGLPKNELSKLETGIAIGKN